MALWSMVLVVCIAACAVLSGDSTSAFDASHSHSFGRDLRGSAKPTAAFFDRSTEHTTSNTQWIGAFFDRSTGKQDLSPFFQRFTRTNGDRSLIIVETQNIFRVGLFNCFFFKQTVAAFTFANTRRRRRVCIFQRCQHTDYSFHSAQYALAFTRSPGTYSPADDQPCEWCPMGKYNDDGATVCANCMHGQYANPVNVTNITMHASLACLSCPGGKYQGIPASLACLHCTPGKFSRSFAVACSDCFAGKYSGSSACTRLPTQLNLALNGQRKARFN